MTSEEAFRDLLAKTRVFLEVAEEFGQDPLLAEPYEAMASAMDRWENVAPRECYFPTDEQLPEYTPVNIPLFDEGPAAPTFIPAVAPTPPWPAPAWPGARPPDACVLLDIPFEPDPAVWREIAERVGASTSLPEDADPSMAPLTVDPAKLPKLTPEEIQKHLDQAAAVLASSEPGRTALRGLGIDPGAPAGS